MHAQIVEQTPNNLIKGKEFEPIATKTELGWIVSGPPGRQAFQSPVLVHHEALDLGDLLQKFWIQEEVGIEEPCLTEAEKANEAFFQSSHSRS